MTAEHAETKWIECALCGARFYGMGAVNAHTLRQGHESFVFGQDDKRDDRGTMNLRQTLASGWFKNGDVIKLEPFTMTISTTLTDEQVASAMANIEAIGIRERRGDWMQTYSGRVFWPRDPRPEEVDIDDIAQALSMICRFNGHTRFFYSVAQHSILVSDLYRRHFGEHPEGELIALLHDAAEAYCGDVIRPIKDAHHNQIEAPIQYAIHRRFAPWYADNIDATIFDRVHECDERALAYEARDVMGGQVQPWRLRYEPGDEPIYEDSPSAIKALFLDRFVALSSRIYYQ